MWPLNEILLIVLEVFPGAYSTEQSSATFLHNTTICWSNPSNWSSFCGTILILIYSGFYWTSIVKFHSLWHEPAPSLAWRDCEEICELLCLFIELSDSSYFEKNMMCKILLYFVKMKIVNSLFFIKKCMDFYMQSNWIFHDLIY